MDIIELYEKLKGSYKSYLESFVAIKDNRIKEKVSESIRSEKLWPKALIQFNPNFAKAGRACPFTFGKYTGQETDEARTKMQQTPPNIILTNYMMLELLMTRAGSEESLRKCFLENLHFLVFDELHRMGRLPVRHSCWWESPRKCTSSTT